jgi:hypothetical protein
MGQGEAIKDLIWWWLSREEAETTETTRQGLLHLVVFQTPINFHSDLNVDAAFSTGIYNCLS